jgi:hypothetical protein
MFDTVLGLPVHALVVHAVVVLVPLCTLMVVVMAVSRTWRQRLWLPLLVLLTVSVGSAYVAKESGEQLQARLSAVTNDDLTRHVTLGDKAWWIVGIFWLVVVLWFLAERRAASGQPGTDLAGRGDPGDRVPVGAASAAGSVGGPTTATATRDTSGGLVTLLGVLAVVAALFATTWIVLTGHSGTAAVWRQTIQSTNGR